MAQTQQHLPTSYQQLQDTIFPSCETFIAGARHVCALDGVSLTITHKSRNTPGKTANQYRGCLVLSCIKWEVGCTFEIKAYGPVEGGWRMRPLQAPGLAKHTVTSWCTCNHREEALRVEPALDISSWTELVDTAFEMPDDFIHTATRLAALNSVSVYLLTLMVSDGQPKPNGRNSTYVPRGFLTLECVEAGNGCPMAIKAREETDGWYMRPWREKGKGDLKGAVSSLVCKHSAEVKQAYLAKLEVQAAKPKKPRKVKGEKASASPAPGSPALPSLGEHDQALAVAQAQVRAYDGQGQAPALPLSHILGVIEQQLGAVPSYPAPPIDHRSYDPYAAHPENYPHASTSSSIYPSGGHQQGSPSLNFSNSLSSFPADPLVPNTTTGKRGAPTTAASRAPKRIRNRSSTAGGTTAPAGLKTTWKKFLMALDPMGRLSPLITLLAAGGIDPGAVVDWPADDVKDFVDAVGAELPAGLRIHFRVLLMSDGKRVWGELQADQA